MKHDIVIPPTSLKVVQKPPVLPPAPPAGPAAPIKSRLVQSSAGVWVMRTLILIFCLGSLGLVYWSLSQRLQPAVRESQQKASELSRLVDAMEQLKMKWKAADIERTRKQYEEARQLLFASDQELVQWQKEFGQRAQSMAFDGVCQFGQLEPCVGLEEVLARIPAVIQVRPMPLVGVTNAPYRQLLRLSQAISSSPKRFDLMDLTVTGNSNSVQHAIASVHLLTEQQFWK